MSEETKERVETMRAVYSLIVVTRNTMRRAMLLLVAVAALTLGSVGILASSAYYIHQQSALVEDLLTDARATRTTADRASDKADSVEHALETRPTLEVLPAASGSAGRPGAVVVIHPAKPSGSAVPNAARIEVPVTLPSTTRDWRDGGLP